MTSPTIHDTEHEITVDAEPARVFDLIARVTDWPRIFPPSVHVEYLERGESAERIRIWATANGEVKSWTSRRGLDRDGLRVTFRQEVSQPPVASMGGEWLIEPLPGGRSRVRLKHDFKAVDDDPDNVDWITRAVDRNSDAELGSLKRAAEQGSAGDELLLSFDDVVRVDSAPQQMYDFIRDAGRWPERIPHVARLDLREPAPDLQLMEMDTRTPDGSTHTTKSIRICLPSDCIVYKQLEPPALMSVHTGRWTFEPDGTGTVVTSTHTVVLIPAAIPNVLGEQATVADARAYVRDALGRNSTATIRRADEFAREDGRAVAV